MTVEGEDLTALSDMQLDVLQEIGNVGAGNSATALSRLIKHRIEMNVPRVALFQLKMYRNLSADRNSWSSVFSCAFTERHRAISFFSFRVTAHLLLRIQCAGVRSGRRRSSARWMNPH